MQAQKDGTQQSKANHNCLLRAYTQNSKNKEKSAC